MVRGLEPDAGADADADAGRKRSDAKIICYF
jgi:hypothetical protein